MGGPVLFAVVNSALLLATIGSGMASQLGAARLLYAMGQDGALPRRFFAEVDRKNRIPRNNVILIGAICLAGAFMMSYSLGADLLNFGALLAFMGVNVSSALRGMAARRMAAVVAYRDVAGGVCHLRGAVVEPGSKGEDCGDGMGVSRGFCYGWCGGSLRCCRRRKRGTKDRESSWTNGKTSGVGNCMRSAVLACGCSL